MMEFTSKKSVGYWVEYLDKFGAEHLVLPEVTFVELYDLDIKIGLLGIILVTGIFIKNCLY